MEKNVEEQVADKVEERLLVLDENGNSTGRLEKRGDVHSERLFHNEVTLWVIDREKGKVLLQRRSPRKEQNANKLGLCAGHVVENETIEEALCKEASEEIGLDLRGYKITPLTTIKRKEPQNYCFSHHFYIFENKPACEYEIQKSELSEVLYMDYGTFKRRMKAGDDEISYRYELGEWDKVFKELDKIFGKK